MNRKECSGCEYHREIRYVGSGSTRGCMYMAMTGQPRGCPPGPHCNRYTRKNSGKGKKSYDAGRSENNT